MIKTTCHIVLLFFLSLSLSEPDKKEMKHNFALHTIDRHIEIQQKSTSNART